MGACCFCGHRQDWEIDRRVRGELRDYVEELILHRGVDTFYSGGMGAFDRLCEEVVREWKPSYPAVRLHLVMPYLTAALQQRRAEITHLYDEVILPIDESVFYKAAIGQRNRWMVQHSDFLIAYVMRHGGGAAQMLAFAEKQPICIRNFAL